jgi:hypothetical protein
MVLFKTLVKGQEEKEQEEKEQEVREVEVREQENIDGKPFVIRKN